MQQVKLISADDCLKFALSGEIDSATSEDFYAQVCAAYEHDKKECSIRLRRLDLYRQHNAWHVCQNS